MERKKTYRFKTKAPAILGGSYIKTVVALHGYETAMRAGGNIDLTQSAISSIIAPTTHLNYKEYEYIEFNDGTIFAREWLIDVEEYLNEDVTYKIIQPTKEKISALETLMKKLKLEFVKT